MTIIEHLEAPDLAADPAACIVVKDETVTVEFAAAAGSLMSAVGQNRYAAGDALVTGSTGDCWSVSRDRFDVTYRPLPPTLHGQPGRYRNVPRDVHARAMSRSFTVARSSGGDLLRGDAGDWLLQYAPGDYGVVDRRRFERVYRIRRAVR